MFETTLDHEIQLRMLREGDAEEVFRLVDANRQHLREWLPWLDANTKVEHSREFIQSTLRQQAENRGFVCVVIFEGRKVGLVGYHPIRWSNRSVELGYWLSRDVVGHGIMTRCCRGLVNHALGELGLNRVAIPVAVGNVRSRAIPERLGFKQEGVIRDAEWLYDHFVDHVLYAMLKREWTGKDAATGSQPIRSETNRTSPAAGSRR